MAPAELAPECTPAAFERPWSLSTFPIPASTAQSRPGQVCAAAWYTGSKDGGMSGVDAAAVLTPLGAASTLEAPAAAAPAASGKPSATATSQRRVSHR